MHPHAVSKSRHERFLSAGMVGCRPPCQIKCVSLMMRMTGIRLYSTLPISWATFISFKLHHRQALKEDVVWMTCGMKHVN